MLVSASIIAGINALVISSSLKTSRANHHPVNYNRCSTTSPQIHHITAPITIPRGGAAASFKLFASNSDEDDISTNDDTNNEDLIQQKKALTMDFFKIAVPAFIQLAAEPLAGLVDTAYLGRLGPEVLGGAGVAISAQYAVSKLYNDPLLRTSISLVASEDGKKSRMPTKDERSKDSALSIAVSSALLLAATVGVIQLLLYFSFAGSILTWMGVGPTSSMHYSAYSYLRVRALGTPAATLWLVTNGKLICAMRMYVDSMYLIKFGLTLTRNQ